MHYILPQSSLQTIGEPSVIGGGHMLIKCDDLVTIHKFCSMLPSFVFEVHPVIPVEEAVRGGLEIFKWRGGLKRK